MLGINALTKRSGIKLNPAKSKSSQVQQLSFRKYTSWFLLLTSFLLTVLFSFLQMTTIHEELGNAALLLALPLGFLIAILIATAIYAFKVGQSGSRIHVTIGKCIRFQASPMWMMISTGKQAFFTSTKVILPFFVEKRFGVGWTVNLGHPISYVILFVPIILIIAISTLL